MLLMFLLGTVKTILLSLFYARLSSIWSRLRTAADPADQFLSVSSFPRPQLITDLGEKADSILLSMITLKPICINKKTAFAAKANP